MLRVNPFRGIIAATAAIHEMPDRAAIIAPFLLPVPRMSLRTFIKRHLPERHVFQDHRHLRFLGILLHDPNIWHLNRHSSAGGVSVGLFCAFIPLPVQVLIAAAAAILLRVNLPLAVVFAFITNPLTFTPLFFLAYTIGSSLLNVPVKNIAFEFSFLWFSETFIHIWEPLVLGCAILGTLSAAAGYTAVRLLWRLSLVRKWEERRLRRDKQNNGGGDTA